MSREGIGILSHFYFCSLGHQESEVKQDFTNNHPIFVSVFPWKITIINTPYVYYYEKISQISNYKYDEDDDDIYFLLIIEDKSEPMLYTWG